MRQLCVCLLMLCLGTHFLLAQSFSDSLIQAFRTGKYQPVLQAYPDIRDHPQWPDVRNGLGTYLTAQAVQGMKGLGETESRSIVAIQAELAQTNRKNTYVYWHQQRGLTVSLLREQLGNSLFPAWKMSLQAIPYDMSFVAWEIYAETLLDSLKVRQLEPDSLLGLYRELDAYLMNRVFLSPEYTDVARLLRKRLDQVSRSQLPDCEAQIARYEQGFDRGLLTLETHENLYLMLHIQGCKESSFLKAVREELANKTQDAYLLRLMALDEQEIRNYQQAIVWIEQAAQAEQYLPVYARDLLMLAELHKRRENFRTARVYALRADKAYPTWGEPFLFLTDLVLESAVFCQYTPLERKALYWLAIDYCERAIGRNPKLEERVLPRIQRYRNKMPDREICAFYGLKAGDSYPIRCWLETTATVRY